MQTCDARVREDSRATIHERNHSEVESFCEGKQFLGVPTLLVGICHPNFAITSNASGSSCAYLVADGGKLRRIASMDNHVKAATVQLCYTSVRSLKPSTLSHDPMARGLG